MRLGPYVIQSLLGAGGMGEVYWARDTRLDRTVASKILHPHSTTLTWDSGTNWVHSIHRRGDARMPHLTLRILRTSQS